MRAPTHSLTCSSGHEITPEQWQAGIVGYQVAPPDRDGDPSMMLELANCPRCHTTVSRDVSEHRERAA